FVNNYYKYGPDTLLNKRNEMVAPDGNSNWFIEGNYVYDYPGVTENNWLGVTKTDSTTVQLDEPVDVPEATTFSAVDAYHHVLENVGNTIPRRDSIDARIVSDIKNGTGRQNNRYNEVHCCTNLSEEARVLNDSNRDSIPDDRKTGSAVDPLAAESAHEVNTHDYTNLEVNLNSIDSERYQNPEVIVTSP